MDPVALRADCARCAALCCVAFAFDRSELFATDKAAGEACGHLCASGACAIHQERLQKGFGGCIAYDCLGAGQRVVQELFAGASWQQEPALLQPMVRAFARVRRAHELLLLLNEAKKLPLSAPERRGLQALERAVNTAVATARTDAWPEALAQSVRLFLSSLRRHVRQR